MAYSIEVAPGGHLGAREGKGRLPAGGPAERMGMALRSQEEMALATVFARALKNVIALTPPRIRAPGPLRRRSSPSTPRDASVPVVPCCACCSSRVLPEILGASAGPAVYLASKRFSGGLGITSIQGLKDWFAQMHLGELEVELDEERVLVKLEPLPAAASSCRRTARPCATSSAASSTACSRASRAPTCSPRRRSAGASATRCASSRATAASRSATCITRTASTPRRSGACWASWPTRPRWRSTTCASRANAASTRPTTRSPGCSTSATCASAPPSSSPRAERHGRKVAFVMLDLDGFGAVNKRAGRDAGDEVLCHWAAALTAQLRELRPRVPLRRRRVPARAAGDGRAAGRRGPGARAGRYAAAGRGGRRRAARAQRVRRRRQLPGRRPDASEELVAKAATTMYTARAGGEGRIAFYSRPPRR